MAVSLSSAYKEPSAKGSNFSRMDQNVQLDGFGSQYHQIVVHNAYIPIYIYIYFNKRDLTE